MYYLQTDLYEDPKVVRNFLSKEECDYLIKKALSKPMGTSAVGGGMKIRKTRNSDSADIELCKANSDDVISSIELRCAKLINVTSACFEIMQITRYLKRGFYRVHSDVSTNEVNQRNITILLYLNDEYKGGETYFPFINKKYKLKTGDALVFTGKNINNLFTDKGKHECCDIIEGEKWIATFWVRQEPVQTKLKYI